MFAWKDENTERERELQRGGEGREGWRRDRVEWEGGVCVCVKESSRKSYC